MDKFDYLILPGLGNSGPNHWQTLWENKLPNYSRISQNNWDNPSFYEWLFQLNQTISNLKRPTIIIAHSLAVPLLARWHKLYSSPNIVFAMLVAPADVDSTDHTPDIIRDFSPIPLDQFSFPSVVISSDNDPFMNQARAKFLADKWGSDFFNVGSIGHINDASNIGDWPQGFSILEKYINKY